MRLIGEIGEAGMGREGDGNREKTGSFLEREGFLVCGGEQRSCGEDEGTERREEVMMVDAGWEDRRGRRQRRFFLHILNGCLHYIWFTAEP